MAPDRYFGRRRLITGLGCAVFGLAGCVEGDTGDQPTQSPKPSPTDTPTQTPSPTSESPTPTATQTQSPTPTPAPSAVGFEGEAFNAFESLENWDVQGGKVTLVDDSTHGTAVHMDDAGHDRVRIRREYLVPKDFSGRDFSMAVKLEQTSKSLIQPMLFFWDNHGKHAILSGSIKSEANGRWIRLDLGVREDTGIDMSSITQIGVGSWVGADSSRFLVSDIRTTKAPDKGYVMLTFDDHHPSEYEVAFPKLQEYGYAGACFPQTAAIYEGHTPDADNYREMQAAGWDIGGHTLTHERLPDYTKEEQRRILTVNKEQLQEMGFESGSRFFRTPFSSYDSNTIELMDELFALAFVGAGSATGTNLRVTNPTLIGFNLGDDYTKAKEYIDAAVKHKQLLGLTFHLRNMPSERAFNDLIDHVAYQDRQGGLEVITPSTLLEDHLSNG